MSAKSSKGVILEMMMLHNLDVEYSGFLILPPSQLFHFSLLSPLSHLPSQSPTILLTFRLMNAFK